MKDVLMRRSRLKTFAGMLTTMLLVDYDLPGLYGVELVRRTRRIDHRAGMPIIVLSAIPMEADAREAGADVCLQKPLHISTLLESIARVHSKCEYSATEATEIFETRLGR